MLNCALLQLTPHPHPHPKAVVQVEDRVLRGMHRGTSLIEQSNFREHYAKVQRGEPSALGLRPAGASSTATGTM